MTDKELLSTIIFMQDSQAESTPRLQRQGIHGAAFLVIVEESQALIQKVFQEL
jgi:hypothetical protein